MNNFKKGDIVKVLSDCQTTGKEGIVTKVNGSYITVKFGDTFARQYNKESLKKISDEVMACEEYCIENTEKENKFIGLSKILGVELEEEFMLNSANKYKITKDGIFITNDNMCVLSNIDSNVLLTAHITKLPFRPKKGEVYYIPSFQSITRHSLDFIWNNNEFDKHCFKTVGVYRTAKEAEEIYYNIISNIK